MPYWMDSEISPGTRYRRRVSRLVFTGKVQVQCRRCCTAVFILLLLLTLLAYNVQDYQTQMEPFPAYQHFLPQHTDSDTGFHDNKNYATGLNYNGYGFVNGENHTHIYIFSVIASNSSSESSWDTFLVNGWVEKGAINELYKCCFFYQDSVPVATSLLKRNMPLRPNRGLNSQQFVCRNPFKRNKTVEKFPVGVTIVARRQTCPNHVSKYVSPAFPTKPIRDMMAICAKVAYGKKNPKQLVEWLEYQILFKVDKIFMYAYKDLIEESKKVLQHYRDKGVIELLPINDLPEIEKHPRYWETYSPDRHQDIQVVLIDALTRMSSYRYATIIDTDEFFVPTDGSPTFTQFLNKQLRRNPNAAAFWFMDHIHVLDWGKTDNESDIFLSQYRNHTEPFKNAQKSMFLPERIVHDKIHTHIVTPRKPYQWLKMAPSIATIHHYRHCREKWLINALQNNTTLCHGGFQKLQSQTISSFVHKIEPNVREVFSKLNLAL